MKTNLLSVLAGAVVLTACTNRNPAQTTNHLQLNGTWKLLTHTAIAKGKSEVTDYTKKQEFIKIINDTHFGFLTHSLPGDTSKKNGFDAGGGRYDLKGNQYTEHLDYYTDKNWQGKSFTFTVSFSGDTLVQRGEEKVEKENVNQEIIEKYIKLK